MRERTPPLAPPAVAARVSAAAMLVALTMCVASGVGVAETPGGTRARPPDIVEFGRPAVTIYDDEDGLPENAVQAIAFDRDGYLWVGTQDGAARYNGRSWTVVNMPNRLVSNNVVRLATAADGGMWFGTRGGGVAHLCDGTWTVLDARSGLPSDNVWALRETSSNGRPVLWVGTDAGLVRVEDGMVLPAGEGAPGLQVVALDVTGEGSGDPVVWAAGSDGLLFLRGGTWTRVRTVEALLYEPKAWSLLPVDRKAGAHEVWAGTTEGFARVDAAEGVFDFDTPFRGMKVWDLAETRSPSGAPVLWAVCAPGDLYRVEGGAIKLVGGRRGVARNPVHTLVGAPPSAGASVLFVGTDGDGLLRLDEGQWATLDTSSGLPHDAVRAIVETKSAAGESTFWFGTNGRGIGRYVARGEGEWTTFDTTSGLPSDIVNCFLEAPAPSGAQAVWAGTSAGPAWLEGDRWRRPEKGSGAPEGSVNDMLVSTSPSGAPVLWVAAGGLLRFERGRWTRMTPSNDGVPRGPILALLETSDATGAWTLWAASYGNGLGRYDGEKWERIVAGGASGTGPASNQTVALCQSVTPDGARTLWVGTQGGGVSFLRLDEPNALWQTVSDETTPALPNNSIYDIVSDDRGGVYVFTNRGCARLTPRSHSPAAPADYLIEAYTTIDGLPSNEFNLGAGYRDSRGRIWGGTVRGVVMIDQTRAVADLGAKPLRVEHMRVNSGAPRALVPGEALAHDENSVEFEYALLSFRGEAGTRYRTQLVGLDDGPTGWTAQPRRSFPYLPRGDYVFRVWGRDAAGNVSGPAEVAFSVRPAPWLTDWAFGVYALAAVALAYVAVRLRLRTLQSRNALLTARIAERTGELSDTVARLAESERQAVEAREEALKAARVKSVFLANVSHELRTPLHAILGFVSLMERRKALEPEDREHLGVVRRSSEHLLGLLNEILSISKIEAGRVPLSIRDFDTRQLLRGLEDMFRVRARSKRLRLSFDVDPSLPRHARGDDGKLRQVLINLLSNAINYTDEGEVRLAVRWRAAREVGAACFEVMDTGRGIAPEEIGDLFKPFVQTESGRTDAGGTGLGLAISRQLVELMGGEIRARSTPGEGSTFSFEVPLRAAPGGAADAEPRRIVGLAAGEPRYRILVVDDKEENRMYLAGLLSRVGFDVQEADDGEDGVAIWSVWRPDLVLMDLRMPKMDGYEAARRIRNDECGMMNDELKKDSGSLRSSSDIQHSAFSIQHSTKIIALSANVLGHDGEAIVEAGCDDFLAKPFREEDLFARIGALLGVRFSYEERDAEPPSGGPLSADRIAALGPPLVEDLRRAATTGNLNLAYKAVEAARPHDPLLAEALRGLVKAYRFDELRDLIEAACHRPTTPGR